MKWDKYMKLAQGEKVLDNPQLLRKAVKKEAKEKAKKAAAWKARNAATAEKQQAAQQRCDTRAVSASPVTKLRMRVQSI